MSTQTSDTKVGATAPTDLDNHAAKANGSPNDPMLDKNAIDRAAAAKEGGAQPASTEASSATGANLDPGNLATEMPKNLAKENSNEGDAGEEQGSEATKKTAGK